MVLYRMKWARWVGIVSCMIPTSLAFPSQLPIRVLYEAGASITESTSASLDTAMSDIERAQADLGIPVTSLIPIEILITTRPVQIHGSPFDGAFFENKGQIRLYSKGSDLGGTLFHELMHWIHFSRHGVRMPQPSWLNEGIPFLAALVYTRALGRLTSSESRVLSQNLSGGLLLDGFSPSEFGMLGLFIRYVCAHLSDPRALLRSWFELSLDDFDRTPDWRRLVGFEAQQFVGEVPWSLVPQGIKTFENIFSYFALALNLDARGLDPWNLYSLELPRERLRVGISRVTHLGPDPCLELRPFDFVTLDAQAIAGAGGAFQIMVSNSNLPPRAIYLPIVGKPIVLQPRDQSPIVRPGDRLVLISTGLEAASFCVGDHKN